MRTNDAGVYPIEGYWGETKAWRVEINRHVAETKRLSRVVDHSNVFHDALIKVHDTAKNGTRNNQSWHDVLEIVDGALEQARSIDRTEDQQA